MLSKALLAAAKAVEPVYVENVFQTWLYTGNGSTQTITNGIDLSGKGGLVWIKGRSAGSDHGLVDTARGRSSVLNSNTTSAALTSTSTQDITAFTSSGFSLGTSGQVSSNSSNITYASWTFRKAAKFFDVVTWTGDGTSSRNISHSLGSTPGFIIVKRTDSTSSWWCWHRSISTGDLSGNNLIVLNTTAAQTNIGTLLGTASSTTFQVGGDSSVNASGATYVAYLFAHDAGGFGDSGNDSVVKCGSFTASATGSASVDLGWEPQFIIAKASSTTGGWFMADIMRGWSLTEDKYVYANTSGAEVTNNPNYWNPSATGFTCKDYCFTPNSTVIYIAIRRGPMKTPTDATKVFSATAGTDTSPYSVGFPTDLAIIGYRNGNANYAQSVGTRLTGNSANLFTSKTNAEDTSQGQTWSFDLQNSFDQNWVSPAARWNFRRAPGFFDVVAYTGTGSARTVSHSLGVAPELMIVKERSNAGGWDTYTAALGSTKVIYLHDTGGEGTSSGAWNNTSPTASVFTVGVNNSSSSWTYIAYLFATCPGVSKVGSYTGTGTTQQINCGFTAGARFVLIKRTDSTGDWYVWDSARGIIAGNDPYLLLNSTAAEVTNTDYVDTFSSGFEISSTAPAAINANGGSFIFLAVA